MTHLPLSPETLRAKLVRELRDDYPAVDVTTVVFSHDFAGIGCCVIPQEKVFEIIEALCSSDLAQTGQQPDTRALLQFVGWVDSWVSNPVGAYSVNALEGLFGLTRDKIVALTNTSTDCEGK